MSIVAWLVFLAGATAVLLLYIGLQRDWRLKQYALDQAQFHIKAISDRMGESRALPLNVEPQLSPEQRSRLLPMEWLPREDALLLRQVQGRILVGRTVPLSRILAPDGRMCIFFENGAFFGKWLSEAEYDRTASDQRDKLRRLRAG